MPDYQLYHSPALPPHVKYQILSFVRIQWAHLFVGQRRYWDFTRKDVLTRNAVIMQDDILISHAEISRRSLVFKQTLLDVCGLSAVFTYPAFRGEGYGSQIVAAATGHIHASGADLGLLVCRPSLIPFYRQQGWDYVETARLFFGNNQAPRLYTAQPVMMCYCSAQGQALQPALTTQPFYVGQYIW